MAHGRVRLGLLACCAIGVGCSDSEASELGTETETETAEVGDSSTDGTADQTGDDLDTSSEASTSDESDTQTETDSDTDTDSDTEGGGDPCGAPETFETGKTSSTEIHVAEDGSDDPNCGDVESPCASLEHAAGFATPGTAVVVHAGQYPGGGFIPDLVGTEDAPIWIGGAPGEPRPVIDGGGQAFHISRARYVIVHDLEVRGATQNGINVDDGADYADPDSARYIVFRDLWVHDVGMGGNQDCLKLSGLDDFWVLDSAFERCGGGGSGSAVDHVGCHGGLIWGNQFTDLGAGGNAIQAKGGAEDIEIRANTFVDAGQRAINLGGSTGFEFFRPPLSDARPNAEARDIRVIANVFRGGVTPLAYVGCVGCVALNNLIVSPENWVFRILQETTSTPEFEFLPASGGRFSNNIVYFDGQVSTTVNVGADTDPDSFVLETNLWYRPDAPDQSDPPGGLPVPEQGGIIGEDPLFADPGGGDFHIGPDSPAAAAGTPAPELGGDLDGACFADPPSIGALEVIP